VPASRPSLHAPNTPNVRARTGAISGSVSARHPHSDHAIQRPDPAPRNVATARLRTVGPAPRAACAQSCGSRPTPHLAAGANLGCCRSGSGCAGAESRRESILTAEQLRQLPEPHEATPVIGANDGITPDPLIPVSVAELSPTLVTHGPRRLRALPRRSPSGVAQTP
jgi:hypothetical protein